MSATFIIPAEFQSQLTHAPSTELRSDSEILASLGHYVPVTSEKNIWAFWHSGADHMPDWCKRNLVSWVRINGPDGWTLRVLDHIPESKNYALNYIPAEMMPETFVQGTMEGEYTGQHASDFIRGAILYLYGGVYMDVGCILFRNLDGVCWDALADDKSEFTVATPIMHSTVMANHFVAARKGDRFIKEWHDMFMHVWKGERSHRGLAQNPLWQPIMKPLADAQAADTRYHWDFKVDLVEVFEYITQVLCWVRLCHIEEPSPNGFNGNAYWKNKVLCWDALSEQWPAEDNLGFQMGSRFLELMAVQRDDVNNKDWKEASDFVFKILSRSVMQKVTHGKNLTHSIALGTMLDLPENEGVDIRPGTFFELLRYGAVNFRQARQEIAYMDAPPTTLTIKKGVLEP